MLAWQVVDVDIAMEKIMRAWFEQRQENRRMLAKTIETHRGFGSGEQIDYARSVAIGPVRRRSCCCKGRKIGRSMTVQIGLAAIFWII